MTVLIVWAFGALAVLIGLVLSVALFEEWKKPK